MTLLIITMTNIQVDEMKFPDSIIYEQPAPIEVGGLVYVHMGTFGYLTLVVAIIYQSLFYGSSIALAILINDVFSYHRMLEDMGI